MMYIYISAKENLVNLATDSGHYLPIHLSCLLGERVKCKKQCTVHKNVVMGQWRSSLVLPKPVSN